MDVLVNNAGGARGGSLLSLPLDDWQYALGLCVTAPFLIAQIVAAIHMVANGKEAPPLTPLLCIPRMYGQTALRTGLRRLQSIGSQRVWL